MIFNFIKAFLLFYLFSFNFIFAHDQALSFLQELNLVPVGDNSLNIKIITNHEKMKSILLSKREQQNGSIKCGCIFTTTMYLYLSMDQNDIYRLIKLGKKISKKLHVKPKLTNTVIFALFHSSERMFVLSPKEGYEAIEKYTEYFCSLWLCIDSFGEKLVSLTENGPRAHYLQEWKQIHANCWDDIINKRLDQSHITLQGINDDTIALAIQLKLNEPDTWILEAKNCSWKKNYFCDNYKIIDSIPTFIDQGAIRLNGKSRKLSNFKRQRIKKALEGIMP